MASSLKPRRRPSRRSAARSGSNAPRAPRAQGGNRAGLFARSDANRDGVVTRAEFDALPRGARAGQKAGMRQAMRAGGRFGGRMFGMADVDRDGRVSLPEAQQLALQHFDRTDLNRDGQVTREERRQARQQMRANRRG